MGGCLSSDSDPAPGEELNLRHFQLLRAVGRGAFGKVRIVQMKEDKKLYALKYINKEKCIKMKAVQNVIQERQLLEQINNPFIVNLQFAFQDDENMFMVLDLMLGGDLRYRLDRAGILDENVVKFYAAEIALALDYLHFHRIVHRDIKPDNLLLDEFGHIHLTDFNVAIKVKPDKMLTAAAGTRAYMAPEILKQKTAIDHRKGYFTTVDWWSLGVVMYECLYGKRPFQGKSSDDLSNSILKDELRFPSQSEFPNISEDCISAVRGFLQKDITKRLGCGPNGLKDIQEHPFFSSIDWEKLEKKEVPPPFVPDSNKVNFDATFELEEMLLEDNPLKAKPRNKNRTRPRGANEAEQQQYLEIENKFLPYSCLTAQAQEKIAATASSTSRRESKPKEGLPPPLLQSSETQITESPIHSDGEVPNVEVILEEDNIREE